MEKAKIQGGIDMEELKFSINISATREKVWETLWNDSTFRDWASIIDEGTYLEGDLVEGGDVQFISSVNGYGVTSLIEKLVPYEFILFRHRSDTMDSGQQSRERQWTGGKESYSLIEIDGFTKLTLRSDVPLELLEVFNLLLPQALERIKALSEGIVRK